MRKLMILLLFSFQLNAQQLFSLEDCIQNTLSQHPDVIIQQYRILKAKNDFKLLSKSRFPGFSASASGGLNGGRSIDPFSNSFVQNTVGFNAMSVSGNVNLFNGFALRTQLAQSKITGEIENLQIELLKKELKVAVVEAFMQVVFSKQLISLHQESEQDLTEQQKSIQEKVNEGLLASYNLTEVEAQLATARFDIMSATNDLTLAKNQLAQLMQFQGDFDISVPPLDLPPAGSARPVINFHPSLRIIDKEIESNRLNQRLIQSEKYPGLSLSAGLGTSYSSAAMSEFSYFNQLSYNFNQYTAISLSIPISYLVKTKITGAKIEEQIIKKQKNKQMLNIKQQIGNLELEINNLKEKIKSAKVNLNAQEELYAGAKEKYNEGMISNLELNTYRLNLERAKVQLAQSQTEYYFKLILLNTILE